MGQSRRPSETLRGKRRAIEVIRGHQKVIRGHQWPSEALALLSSSCSCSCVSSGTLEREGEPAQRSTRRASGEAGGEAQEPECDCEWAEDGCEEGAGESGSALLGRGSSSACNGPCWSVAASEGAAPETAPKQTEEVVPLWTAPCSVGPAEGEEST